MGQLLASLNPRSNYSDLVPEIKFDIENASPSSEELGIYNELYTLLVQPTPSLLTAFKEYKPASEYIRNAIATPNIENEDLAWNAILPTVNMLREFYNYSSELDQGIPILLQVLCKDSDTTKDLDRHPGLTKLFAEILDFVFEFDNIKIGNPTIQNDFSFYRRTLQKGRKSTIEPSSNTSDLRLAMNEDDLANHISLFIAYPTPMLKCVIDITTDYVKQNHLVKCITEWLTSIWAACYQRLNKKRTTQHTDNFYLKVMVISIILYDHIDPSGAFSKNSPINVKNSLKTIQTIHRQEQSTTSNLVSALKYNSKHLNDDSTPKGIKNLVMAI
ncbi:uncharacterized protein BX663DRAFT_452027 [Cokeromyces recurvatus]|uniref:uncharacterized protein n=1 Tax=Cokeromyces recurvatus TaxID=90255 RepID=UPI0022205FE6|nr:uncharacterized protein BX663DRAFT_452027 [Cokeromyces recurvatus]KAI7904317.1 hypothetical protein BX663DRAFT_452027 [Cokeromyces recurvatus]